MIESKDREVIYPMKKKLLAALLAVCMVASMMLVPAMAADEGAFTDVSGDHWASDAIERWAGYGVLNGHDDGTFNPDGPMTRAQFAKFVVELMGLTNKSGKTFADVEADSSLSWAKEFIDIAYTNGIITGYDEDTFGGKREVTFNAGATMLSRALGLVTVEESKGDNFQTAAADKLSELGMLDDNVKADAEPTRALMAGLANNMIGVYVTPGTVDDVTEDGVITGEIPSGIILVVASEGLAVEIKDVTTTAPIVLQGGHVTLTNTTAPSVKVSGGNANIEIDKDSTVDSVTVDGTNASLKVDGTVANVTVTADATISHLEGEGVSKDNVTNNTGAEIEVNGETVAPTPAEPENPDDEQGESTGFVPTPSKPATNPEAEDDPGADAPKVPAASAGTTVENPDSTAAAHTHDYTDVAVAYSGEGYAEATCTTEGKGYYTCKVENCGAKSVVTVPKLGHKWYKSAVEDATCTTPGTITWSCANGENCVKCGEGETANKEAVPALGHQQVNSSKAATCTEGGWGTGIACGREGCTKDGSSLDAGKWISRAPQAIAALGHSWQKVTSSSEDGETTSFKCTRTGCDETSPTCPEAANHANIYNTATCKICGEAGTKVPPVAHATHEAAENAVWQNNESKHWKACKIENCEVHVSEGNHAAGEWTDGKKTCTTCGYEMETCDHSGATKPNGKADGKTVCATCGGNEKACTVTEGAGHTTAGTCSACGLVKASETTTP